MRFCTLPLYCLVVTLVASEEMQIAKAKSAKSWCPSCQGALCQRQFLFTAMDPQSAELQHLDQLVRQSGSRVRSGFDGAVSELLKALKSVYRTMSWGEEGLKDPMPQDGVSRLKPFVHTKDEVVNSKLLFRTQLLIWDWLQTGQSTLAVYNAAHWDVEELELLLLACPCSRLVLKPLGTEELLQQHNISHADVTARDELTAWFQNV
ncbi:unnamed protein product [Symbiodinium natans]|uniref:Uncharacterized protein n=1 Tax=Symbiodinium natans TaxID=878477 RepID=A0A812LPB4_9DINO|nr:unnamed protein product [Symbiodinium natans]